MTIFLFLIILFLVVKDIVLLGSFWGGDLEPNKQEIMDLYWLEFIDWIQDARTVRNLAAPYDVYTDIKSSSTPKNVAFINENNFWLWYADNKWDKQEAKQRNQIRQENK